MSFIFRFIYTMPNDRKRTLKQKYSSEHLSTAVEAVRLKKMSLRAAALSYGVPKSTIDDILKKKHANVGFATVLSAGEENEIVKWMLQLANSGFPATKIQLLDSVELFLQKCPSRVTPFTNNRPGRDWCERFLKRHPEIALRIGNSLSKSRANLTEKSIRDWFDEVSY